MKLSGPLISDKDAERLKKMMTKWDQYLSWEKYLKTVRPYQMAVRIRRVVFRVDEMMDDGMKQHIPVAGPGEEGGIELAWNDLPFYLSVELWPVSGCDWYINELGGDWYGDDLECDSLFPTASILKIVDKLKGAR